MSSSNQVQSLMEQGVSALRARDLECALQHFANAINAEPDNPLVPNRIGGALMSAGQLEAASRILTATVKHFPNHAGSFSNLGTILINMGRTREAAQNWQRAVEIDPSFSSARFNLASLLQNARRLDQSEQAFRELLSRDPKYADAWYSLGHIRRDLGDVADAITCFERAIEIRPNDLPSRSALLYTLLFDDRPTWHEVIQKHVAFAPHFGADSSLAHFNDRSPNRRLRIGYVSPFFLDHVNTELIEPILARHDHAAFEIFVYGNAPPPNTDECRVRPHVDQWRACERLSDDELAALIRKDRIDVLVDLTSHMGSGRPGVFAQKPAPVQINYLAYPATSGLPQIEYRITCSQLDPPGTQDPFEPERLLRLPDTYWCYPNMYSDVPIAPPPSQQNGYVTFGCLNAFVKVRQTCIAPWARVLDAVPNSRLMLLVRGGDASRSVLDLLAKMGIDQSRVTLVDYVAKREHLDRFNQIDVSLDSFPYGGHVTTHDSIWMGLPVVTMTGDTPISRAGRCILSHVGLEELVASSSAQYVQLALTWAGDLARREALRKELRAKMLASPLTDAARFTRYLEAAYRAAWRRWCESKPPADIDIPPDSTA